ncbi:hypothetical protein OROGR_021030 [Orobanche gracilis]
MEDRGGGGGTFVAVRRIAQGIDRGSACHSTSGERENRLRWFGHIKRREMGAPVRRLESWQEEETRRCRGRPKQTWKRVIESDMNFLGIEENLVVNRTEWRDRIYVADRT